VRSAAWIVGIGFAIALVFTLLALPMASADSAGMEGGEGQRQVFVTVGSDFDVAESGRSIPMQVHVLDVHRIPQAGVPVRLTASGGTVAPSRVVTDADGLASFVFTADPLDSMTVRIVAVTDLDGAAQGIDVFYVRVVKLPAPPIYARTEVVSLGVLSGLLLFFSWTEPGRHALFGLVFPLYTRLKKEEVLDHFVRGQVFGAIKTQPGVHFTEIRDSLDVPNGTLSYHLRMLEVTGFVRSERDGLYKRFFPADLKATAEGQGIRLSDLQRLLLDRLRGDPGAAQRDLAKEAGVTQQSISYNLRQLRNQGLLDRVKVGRRVRYRVVEA
jgi:DNA-binding MarR family transcriptional regulator